MNGVWYRVEFTGEQISEQAGRVEPLEAVPARTCASGPRCHRHGAAQQ